MWVTQNSESPTEERESPLKKGNDSREVRRYTLSRDYTKRVPNRKKSATTVFKERNINFFVIAELKKERALISLAPLSV